MAQLVNCLWGPEFNPQHPSKKRSKTQKPGCSNLSPQGWEAEAEKGASLGVAGQPAWSSPELQVIVRPPPHTRQYGLRKTLRASPCLQMDSTACMLISAPTNIHTHTILNNKKMSDKYVQSCYRHFTLTKQRVKVFWNEKLYRGTTVDSQNKSLQEEKQIILKKSKLTLTRVSVLK